MSVPNDWWHLRGHIYGARQRVKDHSGKLNFVVAEPEEYTVNLFDCVRRGMRAATQFMDKCFSLPLLAGAAR